MPPDTPIRDLIVCILGTYAVAVPGLTLFFRFLNRRSK
jgi:hypothetical protein